MQNFTDIPSSRSLSDSLIEILNNDKTGISCNSGTTFPTTNQQVGMLCYRTDQLKLYLLIGVNPDNWRFIMDLSSGIDSQFATKLNAASYTAADVLAKLLTVDGAGNWIYTLSDNTLDHTNPNASGTADQVGESFAVRMFDLDGDVSPTVQLNVQINDDNPAISLGQGEFSALVVDETSLDLSATGNFAGAFQASLGADGGAVAYALEIGSLDSGLRDAATGAVIELHLVDGTSSTITKDYRTIVHELEAYSDVLGDKRRIVALNKCDALDGKTISTRRKALEKASGGVVHVISGAAGMGIQDVLRALYAEIQGAEPEQERGPWQP
mgnify:CR=1 FL=1